MSPAETAETVFPAVPESVAAARRFTRAALARHDVDPEIIDTATLLVSELATNAVVHATSTIRLRIGVSDEIRVEVRDASEGAPVLEDVGPERESGRGLAIVTSLADDWDWSRRESGKVVWFSLARTPNRHAGSAASTA
jgi:anti-sigma regulatory factor (Ser/Thr protein kinase)